MGVVAQKGIPHTQLVAAVCQGLIQTYFMRVVTVVYMQTSMRTEFMMSIVVAKIKYTELPGVVPQGLLHSQLAGVVPQRLIHSQLAGAVSQIVMQKHFMRVVLQGVVYMRTSIRTAALKIPIVVTQGKRHTGLPGVVTQEISHTQLAGVVPQTTRHTQLAGVVPKGKSHGKWMIDRCHVAQKDRNVPGTIIQSLANSGIQLLLMSVSQDLSEGQHQSVSQD